MNDTYTAGSARTGGDVLQALAAQPGGQQLLALGRDREDLALVGGAVRDLLLGRSPRELDIVVAGDAESLAGELAAALVAAGVERPMATVHERFGTAVVEWQDGRIDIAERRAESYPAPGALPDVRPGTLEEDLHRRDFTVNAIAVPLAGARRGELDSVEHALEDLRTGCLRVLHERSFIDDPTRVLRLARYRARLGFAVEARTAELAAEAVAVGALVSISGARVGAELRLALSEADATAALEVMEDLDAFATLHPRLRFDGRLARAALALLSGADACEGKRLRPDLLLLAALLQPMAFGLEHGVEMDMYLLLDDLEFPAPDRNAAIHDAICADAVASDLAEAEVPSQLYNAASHVSPEGVALAGAWGDLHGELGGAGSTAREWLAGLCNVSLLITGEDLLAAGIPEGPEIGRRLQVALLLKLEGGLVGNGREAELNAALRAERM